MMRGRWTALWIAALLLAACGGGGGAGDTQEAAAGEVTEATPEGAGEETADASPEQAAPVLTRLHADGTRIVDAEGSEVRWRGANLGGWMFHETWITLVGYPDHARLHLIALDLGIADVVDPIIRDVGVVWGNNPAGGWAVCPASDPVWVQKFAEAALPVLGQETTDELLAALEPLAGECDDADLALRKLFDQRFGLDGKQELLEAFQDAWLRQADIQWLAAQGFSVVRVPITYRALVKQAEDDFPAALAWHEPAFERLDRLLDWCEEAGIYAVLDIQECPGGQNTYTGVTGLYDHPEMQALTVQLWEKLSDRYRDRDVVAAYSLLAEPYGAPDADARDAVYDLLVKAIRARGDDHLLVIHDGFFGMESLPKAADLGWTNVVYSTHIFETVTSEVVYDILLGGMRTTFGKAQATQGVPYYIGSFSTYFHEDWAYSVTAKLVAWFEQAGYGWSVWTWKRPDDPLTAQLFDDYHTQWGILGRLADPQGFVRPDPHLDSRETLLQKFAAYADLDVEPNQRLLEILTASVYTE
jgi:aryl-phospho-beta-D-glucosidase BglC (GH1 family)